MQNRIIGIDIARALAVTGMIVVNFKVVFGENGPIWAKSIAGLFDGKAAATFVVLAGVGLALMTNSAVRNEDRLKLKGARINIAKRGFDSLHYRTFILLHLAGRYSAFLWSLYACYFAFYWRVVKKPFSSQRWH